MQSQTAHACACDENVTDAERFAQLDDIIADQKDRPGALIPVLQMAQLIFGYLPPAAIERISTGLGKSYTEVAGVISFYSFFSTVPRGRHMVRVCMGTACYVRGGKQILDALRSRLKIDVGQTTPDRQFSLEVGRCFGACGLGPVVMVDDDTHQRVSAKKIGAVLDQYRGTPVQGGI